MCDDSDFGSSSSDYGSNDYGHGGGSSHHYSEPESSVSSMGGGSFRFNNDESSIMDTIKEAVVEATQESIQEAVSEISVDELFDESLTEVMDEENFEFVNSEDIENYELILMETLNDFLLIIEELLNGEEFFSSSVSGKVKSKIVNDSIIFTLEGFNCILQYSPETQDYTITAQLATTGYFIGEIQDTDETASLEIVAKLLELLKLNSRIIPCTISIIDDGDDDLTNDAVVCSVTQLVTSEIYSDLHYTLNIFASALVTIREALFD